MAHAPAESQTPVAGRIIDITQKKEEEEAKRALQDAAMAQAEEERLARLEEMRKAGMEVGPVHVAISEEEQKELDRRNKRVIVLDENERIAAMEDHIFSILRQKMKAKTEL